VIPNACATQALLSVLLNIPGLELGQELTDLKNFTADFPADLRGHAISNSDCIRNAHNSFRAPNPILPEEAMEGTKEEDVFHFIAYLPINGSLYELDGLKPGPIQLGPCTEKRWIDDVQPFIQQRIERYSASEIRFNLMALIRDRRVVYREEIARLEAKQSDSPAGGEATETGTRHLQLQELKNRLASEEQKFQRWHDDNLRRRNNYIPFVFNILRILAEEGKLGGLIAKAKEPKPAPSTDS